jgi:class 3 adenylate cyclase/predicted ATPase
MDIEAWLRGLGLEQYAPAFRANEIDERVLPSLTVEDLKDLGITLIGHRRRLLDAIAALRGPTAPNGGRTEVAPTNPVGGTVASAERRQLTVMFCDLVGSTALASRLDPEDLRDVIAAYHKCVAQIVARFDGFISRYMGDGVLAYFGYPQAHEDDAERAVRAGLGTIDAVGRLDVKSTKLQARVGIATGLVVVGDLIGAGPAQEQSVVGETPNLAARLQALAEPDTVVIAAGTRRLVGNLFEYRDLGVVEVKGFGASVPAWQVLRPSAVASRFEALRGSALTPLVGRDEETDLLLRHWRSAKVGDGQVVLISGEAGIGKSRIAAELEGRLQFEPHQQLRHFCSPYHQDSALYPFADQLGREAGFAPDDAPARRLEKLEALLFAAGQPDEDVALLADLLSMPASERLPLPNLSPQRKKERTFGALLRHLEGLARLQPVIMVFEDVQWIDPTSRELLDLTIEHVRKLPVLLIMTFRPEFDPPWSGQPRLTKLTLNSLDRREQVFLVAQIADGKPLPDQVVAQIVDRTDGLPLFIEELTKSVLESGLLRQEGDRYVFDRALPSLAIPTSLQASLLTRLDRLASVRLVAQIGAAIGREFSFALVRAVSRLSESELEAALDRLVASELVFQRGTPPNAVYSFKHALVQDAVHSSLLRTNRRQLHAQIAEGLEDLFPELMENQPELFAQHYAEARLVEKSVSYWSKAGHRSAARSAMAEAAAQLRKGLDQLARLPETPERQRQKLEFWNALGAVLNAAKGAAAPETGRAFASARELWERAGSPSEFFSIPYAQSRYHSTRGEFKWAMLLDEDLLRMSRQRNDITGLVLGHLSSSRNRFVGGQFASSRSHLEQAFAHYDPISHGSLLHQVGYHPEVSDQGLLGTVLFCLGYPDQALSRINAAIAEARRLAHPPTLAMCFGYGTRLLSLDANNASYRAWVDQLNAMATEQGFPMWRAEATIYRGWAKVQAGDKAEGISLLRSGSAAYRATAAEIWRPHHIALLARACAIAGQFEEAVTLVDDAVEIVERTGERWLASELHRHKGQFLQRQGHTNAAEQLYGNALSIAREQGAKLWELRAAVSLARLRRDQGWRAEALDLLAPVYGWFTEGFDTTDLKEARALLEELA